MKLVRTLLGALALTLVASAAQALPSITVAPGTGAGGYIPLDALGVAPIAMGDEQITNLNTLDYVYAGQTWNQIGVVSNGYLVVGGGGGADVSFSNTALPTPAAPKNILAPFWTDLDLSGGPGIFATNLTDGVNTWLVIEWRDARNFGTNETNTFQVWIGVNGVEDIVFEYEKTTGGDFGFLTIGANDISGLIGATYYLNGAGTLPGQGDTLRVTTQGFQVPVPEPATLALLGAGLLVMAGIRRRRQERAC